MKARITPDLCVACGTCAAACPISAITEGDDAYEVNQETCVGCGSCYNVCPANAIEVVE